VVDFVLYHHKVEFERAYRPQDGISRTSTTSNWFLDISMSRTALTNPHPADTTGYTDASSPRVFCMERRTSSRSFRIVLNWNTEGAQSFTMPPTEYQWMKVFDSCHAQWRMDNIDHSTTLDTLDERSLAISLPSRSFVVYMTVPQM
jgi:hypothetical protein